MCLLGVRLVWRFLCRKMVVVVVGCGMRIRVRRRCLVGGLSCWIGCCRVRLGILSISMSGLLRLGFMRIRCGALSVMCVLRGSGIVVLLS